MNDNNILFQLAVKLRKLKLELEMSEVDFCQKLCITAWDLENFHHGRQPLNMKILAKIEEAFGEEVFRNFLGQADYVDNIMMLTDQEYKIIENLRSISSPLYNDLIENMTTAKSQFEKKSKYNA